MHITYLNYPKVPKELLKELPAILSTKDDFPRVTGAGYYPPMQCYHITGLLLEWIKHNIPIKFGSIIHINHICDTIVTHRDYQTERYKVNYIFDTGGENVLTHFYDDDYVLLESHKVEPYRWHQFNGQINHNVTGIIRPRIAITLGTNTNLFN